MRSEFPGPSRLSLSLPAELFRQLEMMVRECGLSSRSHLMSRLIRDALAEYEMFARLDEMLIATITLVYRGDQSLARQHVARTQADYAGEVISSQHVFLEDDQSLEALLVKGSAARVKGLADALRRVRGVHQLELVATTSLVSPFQGLHSAIGDPEDVAA